MAARQRPWSLLVYGSILFPFAGFFAWRGDWPIAAVNLIGGLVVVGYCVRRITTDSE